MGEWVMPYVTDLLMCTCSLPMGSLVKSLATQGSVGGWQSGFNDVFYFILQVKCMHIGCTMQHNKERHMIFFILLFYPNCKLAISYKVL